MLQGRPVLVHSYARLEALVAVIGIALVTFDLIEGELHAAPVGGSAPACRLASSLRDQVLEGPHRSAQRDGVERQVVTRPSPFQAQILAVLGVDPST
ncbi:MAG: hypothetical protein ACLPUG_08285 [Acidimicrobiales bacterium]|jgi:hypothetical protein